MLKLNYTDLGLHIERVNLSLEELIAQRVMLSLRLAQPLCIEQGTATFLLPADAVTLGQLETALAGGHQGYISLCLVDAEVVEVTVQGVWVAENADVHEGIFLTGAGDRVEFFLHKLWQTSQAQISPLA